MSRRLSCVAGFVAAFLLATAQPASAVEPFGPAEVLVPDCIGGADAAIAADGKTRGFVACTTTEVNGPIWFFRDKPGEAPFRQRTPYTGFVLSVAWDGVGSTYVVFMQGTQLKIGKRVESSGAYSALTTLSTLTNTASNPYFTDADVVASNGKWWAVWREEVGSVNLRQGELFQRRTLLGVQGRTRITTTASNHWDGSPTLAYYGGRVTMVWTRADSGLSADLRIATSTGGAWSSRLFASLGTRNLTPDVMVYAGVTWVTWERDDRIVVADNASGTFHSRTFLTHGYGPTVAVSGTNAFVAWATNQDGGVFIAQRSSGMWTGSYAIGPLTSPVRVLAQGTKARMVHSSEGETLIRTQP